MPEKVVTPSHIEASDVGFRPMLIAGVLMLVALAGIIGLSAWLYPEAIRDSQHTAAIPPFATPPLQPNTAADMAQFRASQLAWINGAGWIDQGAGVAHIPIRQAMEDVARTGIADWPTTPYRPDK